GGVGVVGVGGGGRGGMEGRAVGGGLSNNCQRSGKARLKLNRWLSPSSAGTNKPKPRSDDEGAKATKVAVLRQDSACTLSIFSHRSLNLLRLGDTKIPMLNPPWRTGQRRNCRWR